MLERIRRNKELAAQKKRVRLLQRRCRGRRKRRTRVARSRSAAMSVCNLSGGRRYGKGPLCNSTVLPLEHPNIASTTMPAMALRTTPLMTIAAAQHLANTLCRSPLLRRCRGHGEVVPAGKLKMWPLLRCQRHATPALHISTTTSLLRPSPSIQCISKWRKRPKGK